MARNSRSHSKIKTLRRQHINLQAKNIAGLKLKVCTSCLRTRAKKEREIEAKIAKAKEAMKVGQTNKPAKVKKTTAKTVRKAKAKAKAKK
ncbi:MAG: hypothetical protein NTX66_04345 [Candidatus Falkowbacteria bacterium]|nr:hypothetical protein [Candidatus Falkowbacteria bacterium]